MRTIGAVRRLSRGVCVVAVVDHGMRRVNVYVPWRETMEPNLTDAVNAACDSIPTIPKRKA